MKTVLDLFRHFVGSIENVVDRLSEIYDEEDTYLYEDVYKKIVGITPSPTHLICNIRKFNEEGHEWFDVSGYDPVKGEHFAIEFLKWSEWLSMPVAIPDNMTEMDAVAHILYEMTFVGYDEEEIGNELEKLQDIVKGLDIPVDPD